MTIDEMITVLQAAKDGKKIQARESRRDGAQWTPATAPVWNFAAFAYRVKPEPMEVKLWMKDGHFTESDMSDYDGWTVKTFREVL